MTTVAERRTTLAQRTRSGLQQRKSSSFLRPAPPGHRHSRVASDFTSVDFNNTHEVDAQLGPSKKFVIGIDYGTTFTSVSYYAIETEGSEKSARAADIKTVKEWPDAPYEADEQVPTQTWYSPIPMKRAPLNENEQFDAPKSKPSSTQIVEEEYEDGNENEAENRCAGEGLSTPAVEEERSRLNFVERQSADFYWGYSVQMKRYQEWITRDSNLLVQRPKLMLLGTTYTEGDRKTLRSQITRLINQGIIRKYGKRADPDVRDVRDVITDFLIKVFEHTKQYLARKDGYIKGCPVEFVVTVPTIWTQEASRILQFCVEAAIKETELGCLKNGSVDNLFLIPEPEAGLTWLLQITKAMVVSSSFGFMAYYVQGALNVNQYLTAYSEKG